MEKNGIRIGNQTSFAAAQITEPFEYAVAHGFDAFEFFPDRRPSGQGWTEGDLGPEIRSSIGKRAIENDVRLSVHASWQANPVHEESREVFTRQIEFAGDIGASLLNVHLYTDEGVDAYVRAILPLARRIGEKRISLSIENTPLTPPDDVNAVFQYLRDAGTDAGHVGFCLDVGHANLCEATRNDYLRYVDLLDDGVPIIHVHLHENYGDEDSHLLIFTGPAAKDPSGVSGLLERIRKRGFSGMIILEQWPQPPDSLKIARDTLVSMIGRSVPDRPPEAEPPSRPPAASGGDFVKILVESDEKSRSWREKLGFVHDLLTDEGAEFDAEKLTYLAVYLRFVGTGEIPSREEGGHHRPSHHARMASRIYDRLCEITRPDNAFILRKIYPWLPSFNSAFTAAEPLTRIRDIAHRNDIPHELKTEIKHTLQNKLHRNAGPEDLATSQALLDRITSAEASYPAAFIEEFRRFHEELKEFFNARSLEQDLEALTREEDQEGSGLIRAFLEAKKEARSCEELLDVLELLTSLRRRFSDHLEGKGPSSQRLRIADIRLEDFSFVLLSQLSDALGPTRDKADWQGALRCLSLSVEGLRLSGLDGEECRAIRAELKDISASFTAASNEDLMRLKASLERCLRLTEEYSDRIMSLFPEKAKTLGTALGISPRALDVFAEADIRRHPVFQLSKISSAFLKEIRKRAGLAPWEIVVPGRVSGVVMPVARLNEIPASDDSAVVALLEEAQGDEEIPARVTAIVASRQIPHLSHLAVRARQQRVAVVVSEDADTFRELAAFSGKRLKLDAAGESLVIEEASVEIREEARRGELVSARPIKLAQTRLPAGKTFLLLEEVTLESGGAKAYGAKQLEDLSKREESGFETPQGAVVPFGVMEEALRSEKHLIQAYDSVLEQLHTLSGEALEAALGRMRELVGQSAVPGEITARIEELFAGEMLMVRSSSNCEDLEEISGAGLYESAANVHTAEAAEAVKIVWASLWTRRAAISRAQYGIHHRDARMAVLIQQLLAPELSFILHTINPVDRNRREVYMEIAAGLGETLASGRLRGTPWRMAYDRQTGEVRVVSFASYSHAMKPAPRGGTIRKTIDYSKIMLTHDRDFRIRLGRRLGAIGEFVQNELGNPQDVEGVLLGGTVYLVQTRPQQ